MSALRVYRPRHVLWRRTFEIKGYAFCGLDSMQDLAALSFHSRAQCMAVWRVVCTSYCFVMYDKTVTEKVKHIESERIFSELER
jgi:hypothetical protein